MFLVGENQLCKNERCFKKLKRRLLCFKFREKFKKELSTFDDLNGIFQFARDSLCPSRWRLGLYCVWHWRSQGSGLRVRQDSRPLHSLRTFPVLSSGFGERLQRDMGSEIQPRNLMVILDWNLENVSILSDYIIRQHVDKPPPPSNWSNISTGFARISRPVQVRK